MIQPQPFTLKCPKCHWSKCIKPKGDVIDLSWGIGYSRCPKCGEQTQQEEGCGVLSIFSVYRKIFNQ
jgi:uncharacterized protein (UPF0212 family)